MSEHISLAHGNGGRLMRELIESVIAPALGDVLLDIQNDAATLDNIPDNQQLMITTDGFTVKPLEFPGGNIGSLAVHGTINDLAVSGARPLYLSLNMFIEEGFEVETLRRILKSLRSAALDSNVQIACGDTKVVPRGEGSGVYFATTGVGVKPQTLKLGFEHIQDGDAILVSGPVGDHGIAVMLAREQFGLRGDVRSDAASVLPFTQALEDLSGLRFMRDPTRGGIATVLNEILQISGYGIEVYAEKIPVRDPVKVVCEMLGYDPMYLACEGRVVAVVAAEQAESALAKWQDLSTSNQASIIGHINKSFQHVVLKTELGGQRILEELEDDPLPRIC